MEKYQPMEYKTLLKTTLENRRYGETETSINCIIYIQIICRQIDPNTYERRRYLYVYFERS